MGYKFTNGGHLSASDIPSSHKTCYPKTIEFWMFVNELPTSVDFVIWEKSWPGNPSGSWERIYISTDGKITFDLYDSNMGYPVWVSITKDQWYRGPGRQYHIVATCAEEPGEPYDLPVFRIYVNGLPCKKETKYPGPLPTEPVKLVIGNNDAGNRPCDGLWLCDFIYYGIALSPFAVYRQWAGNTTPSGWGFPTPVSHFRLHDDKVDEGSAALTMFWHDDYKQNDITPSNILFRAEERNPLVDGYTWLWYLLESGPFLGESQIAWRNRIRYDTGAMDPYKDEIQPADLPEIRIMYEGGAAEVRLAKDLARLQPAYTIEVTTGSNRFDKELGDIVWRIMKSLARYPDFAFESEGMDYIKKIEIGSVSVGNQAGAEQARGNEGWFQACTLVLDMWLSKEQMGVA